MDDPETKRRPPFFVVGCGRSGTTMLQLALDAHPGLSVPTESDFIVEMLLDTDRWERAGWDEAIAFLRAHARVRQWGLPPGTLEAAVEARDPGSLPELIDAVCGARAAAFVKRRWGDKTPWYVLYMPELAAAFPGSVFIHLIRDGRDVATSFSDLGERGWRIGPNGVVEAAAYWRDQVETGRRLGSALPPDRYVEVRYEDLVADWEGELRRICEALGEPFSPAMARSHLTAAERLPSRWLAAHPHVTRPPRTGVRDWRSTMEPADVDAIDAVAGDLLELLGYERAGTRSRESIRAAREAERIWRSHLAGSPPRVRRALTRLEPATT